MPVECQTVAGAAQFTGAAAAGLWVFTRFNSVPRSTRIVVTSASYTCDAGAGNPGTEIAFYVVRPGGVATERMLLGRGTTATFLSPAGNAEVRLCGIVLPREPGESGQHWEIQAVGEGKDQDGTCCVDYLICPYPETDLRDAP